MPLPIIHNLARIKQSAAIVNNRHRRLSDEKSRAIQQAAAEVAAGLHDDHFPCVVWQTGSGTQTNMNVNEVVANRAIQLLGGELGSKQVEPNDEVNLGQSSNDCFPTALHMAVCLAVRDRLLPAYHTLCQSLKAKALEFQEILKVGRTHLQDATPITLGQ